MDGWNDGWKVVLVGGWLCMDGLTGGWVCLLVGWMHG